MKFFSLLIGCLFTFCTLKAQDSTVCIPTNVARWYLEQKDYVILLKQDNKIKDQIIAISGESLNTKDLLIQSYQRDSITYNAIIVTNREHLNYLNQELTTKEKEIHRQKKLKILAIIGIGIVGILGIL